MTLLNWIADHPAPTLILMLFSLVVLVLVCATAMRLATIIKGGK